MASKRIQKLLEGASLTDKIKILSEINSSKMESGKSKYSENEINQIIDSIILNEEEDKKFHKILSSLHLIMDKRGEFYFESMRVAYYKHIITLFFEKFTDYGLRLSTINEHIERLRKIPGTEGEIRKFISSMEDDDSEGTPFTSFYMVEANGRLKLRGDILKKDIELIGEEYKHITEIAKTTYKAFYEFLDKTGIEELVPRDIKSVVESLKESQAKLFHTGVEKELLNGLVDFPPVNENMSMAEYFGVKDLFPTFEESSYRDYELGKNNRFINELKRYEEGN